MNSIIPHAYTLAKASSLGIVTSIMAGTLLALLIVWGFLVLKRNARIPGRGVFSIAAITVAHAIRMKVAIVIIVFLAILVPTLPFVLKTDDTILGHVQITLTYGIGMTFLLLVVLTVFIGCASISSEKEGGQMQLLNTKPVHRWQILLGKWFGIMIINAALIIVLGTIIFGLVSFIGRSSAGTNRDRWQLKNSFFTARESVRPTIPEEVTQLAKAELEKRKSEERIPPEWTKNEPGYLAYLIELEIKKRWTVEPGTGKDWKFEEIEVDQSKKDGIIYLRYQAKTSEVRSDRMFAGEWMFGSEKTRDVYLSIPIEETTDSPHELPVPASFVSPDGTLDVVFMNQTASELTPYGISVVFDPEDGVEIMYKRTGFLSNYIRYFAIAFAILGFVAMLSVASSSFLSFPVAALFVFAVLLNCYGLGTFKEFAFGTNPGEIPTTGQKVGKGAAQAVYHIMSRVIPDLSEYGVMSNLNSGRYIPIELVLKSFGVLIVLFGGAVYLLGAIIFTREELG